MIAPPLQVITNESIEVLGCPSAAGSNGPAVLIDLAESGHFRQFLNQCLKTRRHQTVVRV
jgi:hypothetical protein